MCKLYFPKIKYYYHMIMVNSVNKEIQKNTVLIFQQIVCRTNHVISFNGYDNNETES